MASQFDNEVSKWLLFIAAISVVIAAVGRYVIQPVFSAWLFFTLKREPAKIAELLGEPFEEIVKKLDEVRDWQTEKGEEIAYIAGRLKGQSE